MTTHDDAADANLAIDVRTQLDTEYASDLQSWAARANEKYSNSRHCWVVGRRPAT